MRLRAITLVAALLGLVFMACGGDGATTGTPAAPFSVTAGPPPAPVLEVLRQVEAIRRLPDPPDMRVAIVARRDVTALLDHSMSDADRAWFVRTTTLYRLLGFLRPDQAYLDVYRAFAGTAVLGLYQPSEKTLYVVTEDGRALDELNRDEKSTLAHELTHALQDAAFDLGALATRVQDDLDQNLAFLALVEGDAVTTQQLWAGHAALPGPGGTLLFARPGALPATTPAAIERELRFPYESGADWVRTVREKGGTGAVDALFRALPPATSVILHPEIAANWAPATVVLPDLAAPLGDGWKRESGGTLGEFLLRNFLQQRIKALDAANAAAGWAGDHYDVYVDGAFSVAVQRLRFVSGAERDQFVSALRDWLDASSTKSATIGTLSVSTFDDHRELAYLTGPGDTDILIAISSGPGTATKALQLVTTG